MNKVIKITGTSTKCRFDLEGGRAIEASAEMNVNGATVYTNTLRYIDTNTFLTGLEIQKLYGAYIDFYYEDEKNRSMQLDFDYVNKIGAERDSVAAGDDINAPHSQDIPWGVDDTLSEFLYQLSYYVPDMSDVVWSVSYEDGILGYLATDSERNYTTDLLIKNVKVSASKISDVYCSYYYRGFFGDEAKAASKLDWDKASLLEIVKEYEKS